MDLESISSSKEKDCAVCLQKLHHPTQLPCGHIFCFLCVKGVAIQNRKCAMCRAEIPPDYLDHPVILEKLTLNRSTEDSEIDEYQWFYEGRNGWWKYDERSNEELENAWGAEAPVCTLLLAGALYNVDLKAMVQTRRSDPTRRRRVRRDTPAMPAKGIAGIKIITENSNDDPKSDAEDGSLGDAEILPTGNNLNPISVAEDIEVEPAAEVDLNEVVDAIDALNLAASSQEETET